MHSQPKPIANDLPHVVDLVQEDLALRKEEGIRRYGVPLQPFNGRRTFLDMYEEMLDMVVYARAIIYENLEADGEEYTTRLAYENTVMREALETIASRQYHVEAGPRFAQAALDTVGESKV
jgi:hypothetical protein